LLEVVTLKIKNFFQILVHLPDISKIILKKNKIADKNHFYEKFHKMVYALNATCKRIPFLKKFSEILKI